MILRDSSILLGVVSGKFHDTDIAKFEKSVDENYHKGLIKQTCAAASWLNESQ